MEQQTGGDTFCIISSLRMLCEDKEKDGLEQTMGQSDRRRWLMELEQLQDGLQNAREWSTVGVAKFKGLQPTVIHISNG